MYEDQVISSLALGKYIQWTLKGTLFGLNFKFQPPCGVISST